MIKLRPYQDEIINQARDLLKTHRSVVVSLATGAGKTAIESYIAKQAENNNNNTYITTHRKEILNQIVKECLKFEINPGQIFSGKKITGNKVQVAMIQTLYRKLKYIEKIFPDLILADEIHHYCAKTFCEVINFKPETKVIGFTGSPARTDGQGLDQAGFTAMIQSYQYVDLVRMDYLVEPIIYSSSTTQIFREKRFKIKNGEYDQNELTFFSSQKIIMNDTIEMYKLYFNGSPAIVFCCSVEDAINTANEFKKHGWKSEAVYDNLDMDLRQKYIDGLWDGSQNVITNYDLIGEGINIPILSGVIIKRLTTSLINWLQWCGRGSRKAIGKKYNIIIDQAGNVFQHGHCLVRREWSLSGSSKIKESESDIKLVQCNNCGCWNLSKNVFCSSCGQGLRNKIDIKKDNIKIIQENLQVIKPPEIMTGQSALDEIDIIESDPINIDQEIIEKIKHVKEDYNARERLEMLGRAFGKSGYWINQAWKMINNN